MKPDSENLPVILRTETRATVPAVIAARGPYAGRRFVAFFRANIRNPNARRAYHPAASEFFDWCDQARLGLLETYLQDYTPAAGLASDREGPLFRTTVRRTGVLTERPMSQSDAWRMLQRRARDAGIPTAVCNHTFRATAYLENGGALEHAQAMTAQEATHDRAL